MIAVDANLLIYAYDESSPRHAESKSWLEGVLSSPLPARLHASAPPAQILPFGGHVPGLLGCG